MGWVHDAAAAGVAGVFDGGEREGRFGGGEAVWGLGVAKSLGRSEIGGVEAPIGGFGELIQQGLGSRIEVAIGQPEGGTGASVVEGGDRGALFGFALVEAAGRGFQDLADAGCERGGGGRLRCYAGSHDFGRGPGVDSCGDWTGVFGGDGGVVFGAGRFRLRQSGRLGPGGAMGCKRQCQQGEAESMARAHGDAFVRCGRVSCV